MAIILEVCLESPEDALAAQNGTADRLELCSALSVGGLTPSLGTVREILANVRLPVVTMLRPFPGTFCPTPGDYRVFQWDLDRLLEEGITGVVFGLLDTEGAVDVPRCQTLRNRIGSRDAIFHRAFDLVPDPFLALEQLIDLGFRRILTSGQRASALEGADLLAALIRHAAGRIEILPGGGITTQNVSELIARTGCTQVHASLREERRDALSATSETLGFGRTTATSARVVGEMSTLLRSLSASS